MASISLLRSVFLGVFLLLWGSSVFSQESIQEQLRLFDREEIQSIHKRLYTKVKRHELSLQTGGIFNNNGYALVQGSYQYHFYESLGFEVIAGGYGFQLGDDEQLIFGQSSITFSPIYGKVSWFTWAVLNFDLYTVAGAGVVNYKSVNSGTGFMGNVGLGTRLFINEWLSAKVEFRDFIYNRSGGGIGGSRTDIIHNFALTAGLSILLPFKQAL